MNFGQEIELYFRSRFTCISIVSLEEERILHQLKEVCEKSRRALYAWDHADFFQPLNDAGGERLRERAGSDRQDGGDEGRSGFHQCWQGQIRIIRKLRNLAQKLKSTQKTIVVTMPSPIR